MQPERPPVYTESAKRKDTKPTCGGSRMPVRPTSDGVADLPLSPNTGGVAASCARCSGRADLAIRRKSPPKTQLRRYEPYPAELIGAGSHPDRAGGPTATS